MCRIFQLSLAPRFAAVAADVDAPDLVAAAGKGVACAGNGNDSFVLVSFLSGVFFLFQIGCT
jgi:hypothetical protein